MHVIKLLTPTDTNSDGEKIRNIHKGTSYDPRCPIEMIEFHVDMKFEYTSQFVTAVKNYDVWNGFNIRFLRSSGKKLKLCATNIAHGGYMLVLMIWRQLLLLNDDHRCSRTPRNRQASSTWIAKNFLEKFQMNQNWKVEEMMREIN